jgi:hypothetical protein
MRPAPGFRTRGRRFATVFAACASVLLSACESGSCIFLGSPPYIVPRLAQGWTAQFPFSVVAKSDGVSGGEILPAIIDFSIPAEAAGDLTVTPNPLEVSPTQGGVATFSASRSLAPGLYLVEGQCRPRGIDTDGNSAVFQVLVDAADFFSLVATPTSLLVMPGTITSANIGIVRDAGFTDPVSFVVTGVPSGAAVGMNAGPTTGSSVGLNFAAGTAAPGNYVITIQGTADGRVRTATIAVEIIAPPVISDYTLTATPSAVSVVPGGQVQIAISIARTNFPHAVSFFVNQLSILYASEFVPQTTLGNGTLLTINVSPAAPLGPIAIAVSGLVDDASAPVNDRQVVIQLTVVAPFENEQRH